MTNYLDLKGYMTFDKGKYKSKEDLFEALSIIGIEFTGSCEFWIKDKINKEVEYIRNHVTKEELQNIIDNLKNNYNLTNENLIHETCEFLEINFGTGSFDSIIFDSLSKRNYTATIKYSNTNWEIRDDFLSAIGNVLADKIRETFAEGEMII